MRPIISRMIWSRLVSFTACVPTILPSFMTVTRWQISNTSPRLCEM
ncbi:MAG: hypothetical protein ACM3X6_08830 [Patescibacteria group bacterium]